jgi:hypothetical protein
MMSIVPLLILGSLLLTAPGCRTWHAMPNAPERDIEPFSRGVQ